MSSTMMRAESTRPHVLSGSIIASFVALLVLAFGGGYLLSQGLQSSPQGLAPDSVVQLLDDSIAALNAGDADTMATYYAQDAVYTNDIEGTEQVGAADIATHYTTMGLEVTRTSEVVMQGDYASYACTWTATGYPLEETAVATFEIQDGQIVHQWVVGD